MKKPHPAIGGILSLYAIINLFLIIFVGGKYLPFGLAYCIIHLGYQAIFKEGLFAFLGEDNNKKPWT